MTKKSIVSDILKNLTELIIVFVGVFAAFLLSDYQSNKAEQKRKTEIYQAVVEDLDRFYEAGKRENSKGFILRFEKWDRNLDSLISLKQLPPQSTVYGDYWKIEIINSMISSGILKEIDIETFKKLTRFNTVHKNFLDAINDYNYFYDAHVTANFDKGMDYYYKDNSNELKVKYLYLNNVYEGFSQFAELLVKLSKELADEIKEKHLRT